MSFIDKAVQIMALSDAISHEFREMEEAVKRRDRLDGLSRAKDLADGYRREGERRAYARILRQVLIENVGKDVGKDVGKLSPLLAKTALLKPRIELTDEEIKKLVMLVWEVGADAYEKDTEGLIRLVREGKGCS